MVCRVWRQGYSSRLDGWGDFREVMVVDCWRWVGVLRMVMGVRGVTRCGVVSATRSVGGVTAHCTSRLIVVIEGILSLNFSSAGFAPNRQRILVCLRPKSRIT